ncbi:hypothetical protein, partial [Fischerella thermalis]|uniref:hypothetical protein n=1 Tax=Fischerella thermalis TaxID=372787 RepID=UPI001CA51211
PIFRTLTVTHQLKKWESSTQELSPVHKSRSLMRLIIIKLQDVVRRGSVVKKIEQRENFRVKKN